MAAQLLSFAVTGCGNPGKPQVPLAVREAGTREPQSPTSNSIQGAGTQEPRISTRRGAVVAGSGRKVAVGAILSPGSWFPSWYRPSAYYLLKVVIWKLGDHAIFV